MEEKRESNSYRSMLKGSTLFGGVQMFQVLMNLIRSKFVALFLGPDGMGISSLFNSSANTITQFSSLGLNLAVVKETAAVKEDTGRLRRITGTAMKMVIITAIAGALICVAFAPGLSSITFGDNSYSFQFMLLGFVVACMVITGGCISVLQGLQRVKAISIASVCGSATGLGLGVPLYYWLGNEGIVPAMAIMAATSAILLFIAMQRALPGRKATFSRKEDKAVVKRLLLAGAVLMSSALLSNLAIYILNIFIRSIDNIDTVGLYNAANSITNQYATLVFTAMSMDYFPRLASVASDNVKISSLANKQSEIVAYIIAPIVILVITISPIIIRILLTDTFLTVVPLVRWMGIGILFKALSYPLGYIAFAKDNRKLFFWLEGVGCNLLYLILSALFFYFFGLIGLGYAMVVENIIVLIAYAVINGLIYDFRYSTIAFRSIVFALCFGTAGFITVNYITSQFGWIAGIICFLAASVYSFSRLKPLLRNS